MFNKKYNYLILLFVFLVALFLRTYKLSSIPYGFHVDEVKAGWNACSILKTGMDDKGNKFPLYYDSFGDFRPAGLIYLIIPSVAVFGNTIFATRFPFAFIGALTTVALFLLVSEIFDNKKKYIGLITAILLTFNPWHIIASRATSESIVVIFLTALGLCFFIRLFKKNNFTNMFFSIICFLIGFLFYHNIRVLAPVFLIIIIFFYGLIIQKKIQIKQLFIIFVLVLTTILIFLSPEARGRASQVSIKSDFKVLYEVTKMPTEEGPGHVLRARIFHNRIISYIRRFAEEYREYFSTSFLIGEGAKPIRYTVPQVGLITYIEFILLFLGLFFVSRDKRLWIILALLAAAPLPAAMTIEDTPNMQRAIFMIPFLIIIESYGLYKLTQIKSKWKYILHFLFFLYLLNIIYFSHMYSVHQKMSIATYYRNGGNVELVDRITKIKNNYREIVITNSPDDLSPWVAFLNKIDPIAFNRIYQNNNEGVKRFENIIFSPHKCPLNNNIDNNIIGTGDILFIDAEGCDNEIKLNSKIKLNLIETILRPDGSPPFYLRTYETLK